MRTEESFDPSTYQAERAARLARMGAAPVRNLVVIPEASPASFSRSPKPANNRERDYWTDNDTAKLRELVLQGAFMDEIVRELGRTAAAISTRATILRLTIPRAERVIPDVDLTGLKDANPKGPFILAQTASAHRLTVQEVIGRSNETQYMVARQHAAWLIAKHTALSFSQIGKVIGGRDHTTALHSIRVMDRRLGEPARGPSPHI